MSTSVDRSLPVWFVKATHSTAETVLTVDVVGLDRVRVTPLTRVLTLVDCKWLSMSLNRLLSFKATPTALRKSCLAVCPSAPPTPPLTCDPRPQNHSRYCPNLWLAVRSLVGSTNLRLELATLASFDLPSPSVNRLARVFNRLSIDEIYSTALRVRRELREIARGRPKLPPATNQAEIQFSPTSANIRHFSKRERLPECHPISTCPPPPHSPAVPALHPFALRFPLSVPNSRSTTISTELPGSLLPASSLPLAALAHPTPSPPSPAQRSSPRLSSPSPFSSSPSPASSSPSPPSPAPRSFSPSPRSSSLPVLILPLPGLVVPLAALTRPSPPSLILPLPALPASRSSSSLPPPRPTLFPSLPALIPLAALTRPALILPLPALILPRRSHPPPPRPRRPPRRPHPPLAALPLPALILPFPALPASRSSSSLPALIHRPSLGLPAVGVSPAALAAARSPMPAKPKPAASAAVPIKERSR
ncbi:hypothetical protein FB451DRAFT_1411379 [Mycena latifolia]|nr:hypothetical protein FB451DRAFT_1411379 [Mycena latifolia]